MNMIFLLVSFFMISMDITEGLLLRYNAPLINPNNKISLYGNGGGSIGGGGNYILHGGGNGGNDDDDESIKFIIGSILLNIFMMKQGYKNIFEFINNL
jgi:hypothetical protein